MSATTFTEGPGFVVFGDVRLSMFDAAALVAVLLWRRGQSPAMLEANADVGRLYSYWRKYLTAWSTGERRARLQRHVNTPLWRARAFTTLREYSLLAPGALLRCTTNGATLADAVILLLPAPVRHVPTAHATPTTEETHAAN